MAVLVVVIVVVTGAAVMTEEGAEGREGENISVKLSPAEL